MRTRKRNTVARTVVIGIDMSITQPGVCVGTETAGYHCFSIKTKPPEKFAYPTLRYDEVTESIIERVIGFLKGWKVLIVIEDYSFGSAGKTFALAENGGILKYKLIRECGVLPENLFMVSNQHLKMFATGKGGGQKSVIIKEVYKNWGFDTNDDNAADAFVLWKIGMCMAGIEGPRKAAQVEALKRINKYNEQYHTGQKKKT